jgi:hypothetical protein
LQQGRVVFSQGIVDRHQRRLWKNRVTQAEIRLSAFVNNDSTETSLRITVSNVSGT